MLAGGSLRIHVAAWLSAFLLFIATRNVAAQQTPVAIASPGLQEVVVTARKQAENVQNVPDAITVLPAATLEQINFRDLGNLNSVLANYQLLETQQPGTALIELRGVTMQRFQEPSVAIIVDGIEQTSQYQILQSMLNVAQIEVLRGPQGSLYGRNAVGGAINIVTQQPGNTLAGLAEAGYAQGDTYHGMLNLNGPLLSDRVHFSLDALYKDSGGLIENVFLHQKADSEIVRYGRARVTADPTDFMFIDARGSYENRAGGVGYFVNIPSGNPNDTTPQAMSGSPGLGSRGLGDGSLLVRFRLPGVDFTTIGSYSTVADHFYQDIDYAPLALIDAYQYVDERSHTVEARVASNSNGAVKWLVGFYSADIEQDVTTLLYISPCLFSNPLSCPVGPVNPATAIISPFGINQNHNRTYAGFSQVDWAATDRFAVTLGFRYDTDQRRQLSLTDGVAREETFTAPQPKVSLRYHWSDNLMTYATASRGFRSGAFNGTDYITRMYDAETLWNYELGEKSEFLDRRLRLNAAVFYMDYHNQQQYVLQPGTGSQTLFNVPKSRIAGAEIESQIVMGSGFSGSLAVGWLDTKVLESSPEIEAAFGGPTFIGNHLPLVPSFSANLGLQYTVPFPIGTLALHADYSIKQGLHWSLGNVNDTQDAVQLVDARIALTMDRLELSAFGSNLLNHHYYEEVAIPGFGAINPFPGAFPAKPRQVGVNLRYRF